MKHCHLIFLRPAVFRSAIDSWAIRQVFPICPVSRLDEEPRVAATLVGFIASSPCACFFTYCQP